MPDPVFESLTADARGTLELLLSDHDLQEETIKQAFRKTYQVYAKNGLVSSLYLVLGTSPGLCQIQNYEGQPEPRVMFAGGKLYIKITADTLATIASGFGQPRYLCLHELGEVLYLYPTALYSKIAIKKSPLMESPVEGFADPESYSTSKNSFSDIFGDLLAATFSPLTPAEQLLMLDGAPLSSITNRLSRIDRQYLSQQKFLFDAYQTRERRGYAYGEVLGELYIKILTLQRGLDWAQRREFQLKMFDVVQKHMLANLELKEEGASSYLDLHKLVKELSHL